MHPSMESIKRAFDFEHLSGDGRTVSEQVAKLADWMIIALPSSSETVAGLRKLLEAKDCFVRQAVWTQQDADKAAARRAEQA